MYSNLCKSGFAAHEQRILKVFWNPNDADSIQQTFVLEESMRTRDKWLQLLLEADRNGNESWEN
eukprot:11301022-Karenia_brevis.AAC.1